MDKKKLLVLAGAGVHCKVVETAKEMGIYTIVSDYLKDSPAKLIADERLMYNIFDIDELVEYGKQHKIDGVIGFCIDPTQKPAQQIAERLGLPMFGTKEQVYVLTDKAAFKAFCVDSGVDVINEYTLEDVKAKRIKFPILIKPTDSRGSRGATICDDYSQIEKAIEIAKSESSNNEYIIEQYMKDCQDLTISYIVKNGEPELISLGDRFSGREEDNLSRQLACTIQPSRYTREYMEKVNDRVIGMIKKLGIQNGPVFMQGFWDGETVRMYDPGIRFPGNEYERIYKEATGLDPMNSIISYCIGGEINDYEGRLKGSYDLNGKVAIQYMINAGPGCISEYSGLEEIEKLPFVIHVSKKRFVGEVVEATGDVRHRIGEISILVDRDIDEMMSAIKTIQSILKVSDENGNNMIISPFDADSIENIFGRNY